MFARMLSKASICSRGGVIEFGSNIGLNIFALKRLLPSINCVSAIEINKLAVETLAERYKTAFGNEIKCYNSSILDWSPDYTRELVLISGVLIHINPDYLQSVYEKLYQTSNKYILIAEYYNPTPVEVVYRGNTGKLFKRDFAGEMLDKYPYLHLLDYGFIYHRDNIFPADDITWFLLEKRSVK